MTTNREQGEKLFKEAEWIFEKDLKNAIDEENYNIAVRRAQEVVELSLKGCLRILGIDYPKVHDVGFVFVREAGKKLLFKKMHSMRSNGFPDGSLRLYIRGCRKSFSRCHIRD